MADPTCPRCKKPFAQRAHRSGVLEELASLMFVYPFRCQLCSHRFRRFQPGVLYYQVRVDRRQYQRMAVQLSAAISSDKGAYEGVADEVSLGGCGIEADKNFPEGLENSLWSVRLQAPQDPRPITVEAAVVRRVTDKRIGLEFLRLAPEEKERLGRLIFELWRKRAALRQDARVGNLARG